MKNRDYAIVAGIVAILVLCVTAYVSEAQRTIALVQRIKEGATLAEVEAILGPGAALPAPPFPTLPPEILQSDQFYKWRRPRRLFGFATSAIAVHVGFRDGKVSSVTTGRD